MAQQDMGGQPTIGQPTIGQPTAAAPLRQDLFVPTPRYPCFRQPMILSPARNVLLAFAENRNVSACAPAYTPVPRAQPNEIGSLLLRRSTNGGRTWTDLQTIYASSAPGIDFYVGVYDSVRQRCWLFLQEKTRTLVFTSEDMGARWSVPRDLATWNASRTLPLPLRKGAKPAVGHGLQLASGRLVLPFVCRNASATGNHTDRSCPTCNACLLLSDDGGASFRFGGVNQAGSRESQLVETAYGMPQSQLYVNARNMGPAPGVRMVARSLDGGESLGEFGIDAALTTPVTASWTGIVASVVGPAVRPAPPVVVYSSASDATRRINMTLRVSHDGAVSWSAPKSLWRGPAAYSDLAMINETHTTGAAAPGPAHDLDGEPTLEGAGVG